MASLENVVTITGNLVADPELKYPTGDKGVVNLAIAHTPRVYDRDSNGWVDGEPIFIRGSLWGPQAENITNSLSKGSRVIVVGSLKQRSYDSDGKKMTVTELAIEEVAASLKFATVAVSRAGKSRGSDDTYG